MDDIIQLLEEHDIHVVKLPANCTDRLEPMDISVNKAAKKFLWQKFNIWCSELVAQQLEEDDDQLDVQPVNLTTAAMRSIGARWIVQMYKHLCDNPQIIVNGFLKARIPQPFDSYNESAPVESEVGLLD